jgi:GNAT superfamily N-acetyltransferase
LNENQEAVAAPRYDVKVCSGQDMTEDEIADCVALITAGGAVDPDWAAASLPRAQLLAIVRTDTKIVGVGAIKRVRPAYAAGRAALSAATFDANMSELGYVVVDETHQGHRISTRIVDDLLKNHAGPLYATTDSARMKKTLERAGFVQHGHEWPGQRGQLSLWIKEK